MMIPSQLRLATVAIALALIPACAARTPAEDPAPDTVSPRATILSSSSPTDGAILSKSPENLMLRFARPARLHEVTVAGPGDSLMPVMVTSAGETLSYSIPLPDLEPGAYQVNWRAESAGQSHSGTIRFTLR